MLSERLDYIVALFQEAGITHWFVSPGSRNAPIVAALIRNGHFKLHSFPDERSSAFAAMGSALKHQYPAAFLCTSGSALANAYPAVLEAYYQRVPLLIVSADRPEDRIDQWDGQTIRQKNFFGNYVRGSYHLDARSESTLSSNQGIYDCIRQGLEGIPGPTHINISLSEPIYEGIETLKKANLAIASFVYKSPHYAPVLPSDVNSLVQNKKVMLVIGMHKESSILSDVLAKLENAIPIFCDISSQQTNRGLSNWDWGLFQRNIPESLKPELLITMGMGILSKSLKTALNKWNPKHIHVGLHDEIGDPFKTQPELWKAHEADFAEALFQAIFPEVEVHNTYKQNWETFIDEQKSTITELEFPFNLEAQFMSVFLKELPDNTRVHLGNSMTVRYGSWVGQTGCVILSNRGVSGIDGCLSTAVGDALANPDEPIWAVLGDVSAVYDSHALWTTLPQNLKIVVYNNSGGRIFDFISGPREFPSMNDYIQTPRTFDFKNLAEFFAIKHEAYPIQVAIDTIHDIVNLPNQSRLIELRVSE